MSANVPARINFDAVNKSLRRIAEDLKFTEGPVWVPAQKCLLFSDIPADTIYRWSEDGGLKVFRRPSRKSNGNSLDLTGRLLTCEHGSRTLTRTEKDGKVTTLAASYNRKKLNSPNDVVVKSDGTIWFTDPPYGIKPQMSEQPRNHVFRLDPGAAEPVAVADDMTRPNGLCFSPDEKHLYVANSDRKAHHVRRFAVRPDNTLAGGKVFVTIAPGGPDGMRVDSSGRLYSTAGNGVQVFSPEGKLLGVIRTPKPAANCAFGGPDGTTLFITARGSVWAADLAASATSEKLPPELATPNYRITDLEGIGYDRKLNRQDPSNVLKIGQTYYVWYTQRKAGVHPYASTIFYATSKDGRKWTDRGEALGKGAKGAWDSFGVITPYAAAINGKYYLFYTGTSAPGGFRSRDPNGTLRYIGCAVADKPDGPWRKPKDNRVIRPDAGQWDSLIVDDAHVIVRGGKYWLYYKGGHGTIRPDQTKWGLAIADKPAGPYVKYKDNPVLGSGHTVCVWPHREGVAALVDNAGPERHTVQYAADGIRFRRTAKIKRVLTGGGPYDPDAFSNTTYGRGIRWGVAQHGAKGRVYIVRFDCDLAAPNK